MYPNSGTDMELHKDIVLWWLASQANTHGLNELVDKVSSRSTTFTPQLTLFQVPDEIRTRHQYLGLILEERAYS